MKTSRQQCVRCSVYSNPANDNLMELLLVVDALKDPLQKLLQLLLLILDSKQDRKVARTSISAKVVANLLTNAGANRIVTVDLHKANQGFFKCKIR